MSLQKFLFSAVVVLAIVLQGALACFVTNCPPGGKRSAFSYAPATAFNRRQCLACGPAGKGRCFGTSICCGDSFGCFINTEETSVCRKENYIRTPCFNSGVACGINDKGICAADGVCCTEKGCTAEEKCLTLSASMSGYSS
ncbi:putative Conopressin/neurophysin [Hypsibius exemplaris]|uniref:Conopressin/neurophysin n=1 Tax=Hypsibius exemplaris TaxID=2072580 RepID=A0A1W0XE35_HYPEX|nr:putative Conopressin/neurophysin [Hypsibius exemplaris]